jgi:thiol-disulfide isomerase/thioredoxin
MCVCKELRFGSQIFEFARGLIFARLCSLFANHFCTLHSQQSKMSSLPSTTCRILGNSAAPQTLLSVVAPRRFALLDFWTRRCTRCPAALDKLNALAPSAREAHSIEFVSVNLDDHEGATALAAGKWENMQHVSVDEDTREELKQALGMSSVPFYVIITSTGRILTAGSPKDVPVEQLAALLLADGENSKPFVPQEEPAHSSSSTAAAGGGCVNGVCPLPRRAKKVKPVEQQQRQPLGPAEQSESANNIIAAVKPEASSFPEKPAAPTPAAVTAAPAADAAASSSYTFVLDEDF